MYNYSSLSTYLPDSFLLLLLLLLRRRRRHIKNPHPHPLNPIIKLWWSDISILNSPQTSPYTKLVETSYPWPSNHLYPSEYGITEYTMNRTTIGAAVIPQGSFLPSIVSPRTTRRKSSYKFMGKLRERVTTPPYTTPYQENKDDNEDHWGDGGRDWWFSAKKRDRVRGPSLTDLFVVACAAMHDY